MNSRFKFVVVTSSTFLVVLLLLGAVIGQSASPEEPYRQLSVYSEVLSRIKSEYVEEPDIKNVTLGAMNGLLESLDPFASYLSADQYKQYLKSQEAKKAGVGLVLSRKFGYVGVVNSIPGSAAHKAGLGTGDMLESIAGVATRDMPLAYAEMLLHGDAGRLSRSRPCAFVSLSRRRSCSHVASSDIQASPRSCCPMVSGWSKFRPSTAQLE